MDGVKQASAEPFCYPLAPHERKHAPGGYSDYREYHDWLRDEFDFRCVYCLKRESWDRVRAVWPVEHLIARSKRSDLATEYSNLVNACAQCNSHKSDNDAPDPCLTAYGRCVSVSSDGQIRPLNREGKKLIRIASLDDSDTTTWRRKFIALISNLRQHAPESLPDWLGFPDHLPDLRSKRPPKNSKPEGAKNCRFEQRKRNTLPSAY